MPLNIVELFLEKYKDHFAQGIDDKAMDDNKEEQAYHPKSKFEKLFLQACKAPLEKGVIESWVNKITEIYQDNEAGKKQILKEGLNNGLRSGQAKIFEVISKHLDEKDFDYRKVLENAAQAKSYVFTVEQAKGLLQKINFDEKNEEDKKYCKDVFSNFVETQSDIIQALIQHDEFMKNISNQELADQITAALIDADNASDYGIDILELLLNRIDEKEDEKETAQTKKVLLRALTDYRGEQNHAGVYSDKSEFKVNFGKGLLKSNIRLASDLLEKHKDIIDTEEDNHFYIKKCFKIICEVIKNENDEIEFYNDGSSIEEDFNYFLDNVFCDYLHVFQYSEVLEAINLCIKEDMAASLWRLLEYTKKQYNKTKKEILQGIKEEIDSLEDKSIVNRVKLVLEVFFENLDEQQQQPKDIYNNPGVIKKLLGEFLDEKVTKEVIEQKRHQEYLNKAMPFLLPIITTNKLKLAGDLKEFVSSSLFDRNLVKLILGFSKEYSFVEKILLIASKNDIDLGLAEKGIGSLEGGFRAPKMEVDKKSKNFEKELIEAKYEKDIVAAVEEIIDAKEHKEVSNKVVFDLFCKVKDSKIVLKDALLTAIISNERFVPQDSRILSEVLKQIESKEQIKDIAEFVKALEGDHLSCARKIRPTEQEVVFAVKHNKAKEEVLNDKMEMDDEEATTKKFTDLDLQKMLELFLGAFATKCNCLKLGIAYETQISNKLQEAEAKVRENYLEKQ